MTSRDCCELDSTFGILLSGLGAWVAAGVLAASFGLGDAAQIDEVHAGIISVAGVTAAVARNGLEPKLEFEVIAIRRNTSGGNCTPMQAGPTANGYRMTNCSLLIPLLTANIPTAMGEAGFFRNDRLAGVPDWLTSERYDIDARISGGDMAAWKQPTEQKVMLRAMLEALLVERCKLAVHREEKEVPVYWLVTSKGGPKFKEAETLDVAAMRAAHPAGTPMPGGLGSTPLLVAEPAQGRFSLFGTSMISLGMVLTSFAGRPVQDKTGLTGRYDVVLHLAMNPAETVTDMDNGPSVFSAVQEQLGLKLEPAKGQVETLVIDHIERPSEN